jgi:hypothetical protein
MVWFVLGGVVLSGLAFLAWVWVISGNWNGPWDGDE